MYRLLRGLLGRLGVVLGSVVLTIAIIILSEVVTILYAVMTGWAVSSTALILATLVPAVLCPPVYYLILTTLAQLDEARRSRGAVIKELEAALADVNQLSGLLPICSHCKKIRDDEGYWSQIELYISSHSEALFTHGICPECMAKHFPQLAK